MQDQALELMRVLSSEPIKIAQLYRAKESSGCQSKWICSKDCRGVAYIVLEWSHV